MLVKKTKRKDILLFAQRYGKIALLWFSLLFLFLFLTGTFFNLFSLNSILPAQASTAGCGLAVSNLSPTGNSNTLTPSLGWSFPTNCDTITSSGASITGSGITGDGFCFDNTSPFATNCTNSDYNNGNALTAGSTYTVSVSYWYLTDMGDSSFKTTSWTFTATVSAPSAPTGFSGTATGVDRIDWTWNPLIGQVDYIRWRGGTSIGLVDNHLETGLSANYRYEGWITTCNSGGCSPESNHDSKYTKIQSATGATATNQSSSGFTANASGTISAPNPNTGSYTNYIRFELHNNSVTNCTLCETQVRG